MTGLEVHAHMNIRPGLLDAFQKRASELIRLTKEKDSRTLRYDWFISRDGTECEVHEAYVSSDGLLEHNDNIRSARDQLFAQFAVDHFMTIYGDVSQELADLLDRMQEAGHMRFTLFSFAQGLESSEPFVTPA